MKRLTESTGSIAPLGIGLFLFSMVLMLVISSATSLFVFQKRLTNIAESAALFAAQTNEPAAEYLRLTGHAKSQKINITNKTLSDSVTVEVIACEIWSPMFVLFTDIASRQVCAHAAARAE